MKRNSITKTIPQKADKWSIAFLVVLIIISIVIPAVMSPPDFKIKIFNWSANIVQPFNYVMIKIVITQFLLIILFIFWLYYTIEKAEISLYKDPAYIPLICLFIWCFINLFCSSFLYASIRELERLFTCFFLYFVVVNLIKKEKDIISMVIPILIVFVVLSLSGLSYFWKTKDAVIISTFGNPNFFSAYLIMILPLVILVGIYNFLRNNFFISSLIFLLSVAVLFLIYILSSQGAWIALVISFIFLITLFVTKNLKTEKKVIVFAISMLSILLILGAISLLLIYKVPQIKAYIDKDITSGTVGIRINIWQGTLRMIKARPFTGWGMGTYPIVYPHFRIPEYFLNPMSVNATDHAHNEILELTSEIGIIGLGIFLWILGVIFLRGIRVFYNKPLNLMNIVHAGLLAGVLALFIQNLTDVNFRLEASILYFYFFLGLISAECKLSQPYKEEDYFSKKFSYRKAAVLLIIPIAIFLGFIYTHETVRLIISSSYLKDGIVLRDKKKWDEAIRQYEKALYWDKYNWKAYYRLGFAYAETNKANEALAVYFKLKEISPDYADLHYNLGSLYLKMAKWENAKEEFQKSIEQNPYEPKTHYNLAVVLLQLGEIDNAIKEDKRAISVQEEKKKISSNLPDFVSGYVGLGDIYYSQEKWKEASQNYGRAVQLGEKNAKILLKLGNSYSQMQDFKNAKRIYEEAFNQDSSLVQVKELIKQLDEIIKLDNNNGAK